MKEMIYKSARNASVEILHSGIYRGCKFAILSLGTHPAAYVECKLNNCTYCDDKRLDQIDVHGGFTYFGKTYWNEDDKEKYLGWDYAHYMDYAGYEMDFPVSMQLGGKRWTTAEIYEEVKAVIKQLNVVVLEQAFETITTDFTLYGAFVFKQVSDVLNDFSKRCVAENELASVSSGAFVRAFSYTANKICEDRETPNTEAYIDLCKEAKRMLLMGNDQCDVLWHFDRLLDKARSNKND